MEKILKIESRYAVLPIDNIDTDQIIPARFLKGTSRKGLGVNAFYDWRYTNGGKDNPAFVLNQPEYSDVTVLVAGDNFGCGSSREHAPWALTDYGLKAVVSTQIADIFRNNALKNGFVPVQVDEMFHEKLLANPGGHITIDIESMTVSTAAGDSTTFELEPFARYRLLNGVDELDFLLGAQDAITSYEGKLGK